MKFENMFSKAINSGASENGGVEKPDDKNKKPLGSTKENEQIITGDLYVDNLTVDKFNKIVSSAFATKIEQDKEIDEQAEKYGQNVNKLSQDFGEEIDFMHADRQLRMIILREYMTEHARGDAKELVQENRKKILEGSMGAIGDITISSKLGESQHLEKDNIIMQAMMALEHFMKFQELLKAQKSALVHSLKEIIKSDKLAQNKSVVRGKDTILEAKTSEEYDDDRSAIAEELIKLPKGADAIEALPLINALFDYYINPVKIL